MIPDKDLVNVLMTLGEMFLKQYGGSFFLCQAGDRLEELSKSKDHRITISKLNEMVDRGCLAATAANWQVIGKENKPDVQEKILVQAIITSALSYIGITIECDRGNNADI